MKNKLNDALPTTTEFQDVGEMTMKMRMVKSPEELGKFTKVSFLFKTFENILHKFVTRDSISKVFQNYFYKKRPLFFYTILYAFVFFF